MTHLEAVHDRHQVVHEYQLVLMGEGENWVRGMGEGERVGGGWAAGLFYAFYAFYEFCAVFTPCRGW